MTDRPIGAVCGLKSEAALLVRDGRCQVLPSGADSARAEAAAERLAAQGVSLLLSFGLCGALAPELKTGDLVLPESVVAEGQPKTAWTCDPEHLARLRAALPPPLAGRSHGGRLLGLARVIDGPEEKLHLAAHHDAVAVDMESQAVAAVAERHGLPFLVLRACSDEVDQRLPEAALRATRPDGSISIAAVLLALARRPGDLADLLALGKGSKRAHKSLGRAVETGGLA